MTDPHDDSPKRQSQDPWESLAADESDLRTIARDATSSDAASSSTSDGGTGPVSASLTAGPDERRSGGKAPDFARARSTPPVEEPAAPTRGGGWTIPLLCVGISLVACCVLIPQADANRRLVYERQKLQTDLKSIQKQVTVNGEFLKKIEGDPNLAERLAQRQMKIIREGTRVLEFKHPGPAVEMSPFHLVTVAPPPPAPAYKPLGGFIASLCYNPRSRLYLLGSGLTMIAAGLVLGYGAGRD